MTDFLYIRGTLAGGSLGTDADPNVTAPADKQISATPRINTSGLNYTTVGADQACTIEGWVYSKTLDKWFQVFSQVIATAYVAKTIALPIPSNMPFFARLSENAANAKIVAVKFH